MPDLTYQLTNEEFNKLKAVLTEKGFALGDTSGEINHDGVTINYVVTPINQMKKIDLTITHHSFMKPKGLIIDTLQDMMKSIQA